MIIETHNFALSQAGIMRAVVYESKTDTPFPHLPFETVEALADYIINESYTPDQIEGNELWYGIVMTNELEAFKQLIEDYGLTIDPNQTLEELKRAAILCFIEE